MCSIPNLAPARRSLRPRTVLLLLASAVGTLYAPATPAGAHPGQWSPSIPTNPALTFTQIHMALLPGNGVNFHSRIVTWSGASGGAELGWNPDPAGCDTPSFSLPVLGTWNPQAEIFCAGHGHLATGDILTIGGDDVLQGWGIRDALAFTPGTGAGAGSWSARPKMRQARFYPTATTLRDGRLMAVGGQRYQHVWIFGGRIDGDPPASGAGDKLYRYGRGTDAVWDPLVRPDSTAAGERPAPREGHTTAYLENLQADVYFGGKNGAGPVDNNTWLLRRQNGQPLDGDYTYVWQKLALVAGSDVPIARSDHSAAAVTATEMIVFGGAQGADQAFWRLFKDEFGAWRWQPVTVNASASAPTVRYGHAAVYQATARRMIVFGGSDTPSATPVDGRIWAFKFDAETFASGAWEEIPVAAGPRPTPRRDHIMVLDPTNGPSLLVYSGSLGTGVASDTLWRLNLGATPSATWNAIPTTGTTPGPRANHSGYYDDALNSGRLILFGGEPAPSDAVDRYAYTIDPFASGTPAWVRGDEAPDLLSGHTAAQDPEISHLHARIPEIYTPGPGGASGTWSAQTSSGWLPPQIADYPVQFLVPGTSSPGGGGRVVRVGPDPVARFLDIPASGLAGSWQPVPLGDNESFQPQTGVVYAPGKILVAGDNSSNGVGTVKTLDALAFGSGWQVQADMAPRTHHNLVLLPSGKVMVLGGCVDQDTPVDCPQIWDPATGLWTKGTPPCDLDPEPVTRCYHSVAMLLPTGEVITGGGSAGAKMRRYCPPYLFDAAGGLATRPQITSAPATITYGESFVIDKPPGDQISSVCLIRPGAVTHSFDQNQRYVSLDSVVVLPGDAGLRVVAPTSGSAAPPGDYLLFILNQLGVPSIARWVRLGNCTIVPCDTDSPARTTDLSPDIVGPNEVWLAWTAPGDDTVPLAGEYDLRYATAPLTTEIAFAAATPATDEPPVAPAGTPINSTVSGLTACTSYSLGLKTLDGRDNASLRSNTVAVTTTCGGAGGGFSVRQVREENSGAESRASVTGPAAGEDAPPAATSSSVGDRAPAAAPLALRPGAAMLVVETQVSAEGGWRVTVRRTATVDGLDPADLGAIVSQVKDRSGSWRNLVRFQPAAGQSPLGLCALRDGGRIVLPPGAGLERVTTGLRAGAQNFGLGTAAHSRLGAMNVELLAGGGSVELTAGDSFTLDYSPLAAALPGAAGWYLLVRPGEGIAAAPAALRPQQIASIPTRFALHPNQPNPFRGSTVIPFDLPHGTAVRLEVFDILGRRVATLVDATFPAGSHAAEWNQRDAGGSPLRPGVYSYRLSAGEFRARRKLTVIP